jgi:dTDP-4-amino-4,6-dideoxygalactose transaminase
MRWRALRPVGEPLVDAARTVSPPAPWPKGYRPVLVQSGTAALALALLVVKGRAAPTRRRVLLPAYGCPDLVAAVVHAGLEPELIDTAPNEPFMNLAVLERRLDDGVLAVLGVHFLGLADRIAVMSELARQHGAVVIEDSAQRIPGAGGLAAVADLVVLSFGRGKPAGALGGGALLVRNGTYSDEEITVHIRPTVQPRVPPALKRLAYNWLIGPGIYGALTRVPGLGIGATRYHALQEIAALDEGRGTYGACQFEAVAARGPTPAERVLRDLLRGHPALRDFSESGVNTVGAPLLRYPVLCRSGKARDAIHARLQREGLGSSVMYGRSLADLPGVPPCRSESVGNAREFAARLLTLPVHTAVRHEDLQRMEKTLRDLGSEPLNAS